MSLRVLLARAARDKAVHSDGLAVAKRFSLMGHCAHHRSHVEELLCNHRAILVPVDLLPALPQGGMEEAGFSVVAAQSQLALSGRRVSAPTTDAD